MTRKSTIQTRAREAVTSAAQGSESEGQRLLCEVAVRQADIAEVCGVSRPLVSQWRTGKKRPSSSARRALEREYGIPASAWDLEPGAEASPAPADPKPKRVAPSAKVAESAPDLGKRPSTLSEVNEELRILKELREENLLPSERMKLSDSAGKMLAIKVRLEKELELFEDSAVKAAPFWRRIRDRIVAVVRPCPTCARALADALEEEGA